MTEPQSYRNRAGEVRSDARAHLMALRQERMEKRKRAMDRTSDAPKIQSPALECLELEDVTPDQAADISDELLAPVSATLQESHFPTDTPQLSATDDIDDLAVENAAMSEMLEEEEASHPTQETASDDAELHVLPTDGIEEELSDDPQPADPTPASADQQSGDLDQLPGAGPGLVWMLNQCGITTLAELAQADATQLSTDLGIVGQILDVAQWIAFAQDA